MPKADPGAPAGSSARPDTPSRRVPQRTCVGCRTVAAQSDLIRYVLRDGIAVPDPERRLPGRGAYLHDSSECRDQAQRRGGFARSFKARVTGG